MSKSKTATIANEVEDVYIKPDMEIVGLEGHDNGRSCSRHECCGIDVKINTVLRLTKTVVTINGNTEEAIKLQKVEEGTITCTVAFVPRCYLMNSNVKNQVNRFCQVVEMYNTSNNTYKQKLSKRNKGMASVAFLDEIPVFE